MACLVLGEVRELEALTPELRRICLFGSTAGVEVRARAAAVLANVHFAAGEYETTLRVCADIPFNVLHETASASASAFGVLAVKQSALFRLGRYAEAGIVCGQALSIAEAEADESMQGDVWFWMGNLSKITGQLIPSLRMYTQAGKRHQRAASVLGLARDHLNRAAVLNRLGQVADSNLAYHEARRVAAHSGDRVTVLRTLIGQGMTSLRLGDLPTARRHLLTAWLDARRIRAAREICLCTEFLGELQIVAGRHAAACRTLRLCRRLAERLAPEGDLMAELGVRESLLELSLGRRDLALACAREAIDLCLRKGMAWEEAQAHRLAGAALASDFERSPAREELGRAEELFTRMGERLEIDLARAWLAWLDTDRSTPPPALHPAQMPHPAKRRDDGMDRERLATDEPGAEESAIEESARAVLRRIRRMRLPLPPRNLLPPSNQHPARPSLTGRTRNLSDESPGSGSPALTPEARGLDPIWNSLGLLTRSEKYLTALLDLQRLAQAGSNILILGETGTGKELLARAVHKLSGREGRLVPFNCAGCPAGLVEAELFGVERGAFTGADQRRSGLVRRAAGGTLFLDEVGDLPPESQGVLLRFLDSGEMRPLGSDHIRSVELGIVAATLHPLDQPTPDDRFRRDLYYRLAEGFIRIPPLRERSEDLQALICHLWERTHDATPPDWLVAEPALRVLALHAWPGNIRELRHFLRRLSLRPTGESLAPREIAQILDEGPRDFLELAPSTEDLRDALTVADGNRRYAARLLGISRQRLYRLIEKHRHETWAD
jgi:transcriptional regulator with AAA-type ATPase domain